VTVTVALIQMRYEKGAIDANLAAMDAHLRAAGERGAEIVCFPEASIAESGDWSEGVLYATVEIE